MKRLLIFLMPFVIMLGAGCLKHSDETNNFAIPEGNFAGTFMRIHYSVTTSKYDTLQANLNLSMDINTGYKVTGDTSTVHAGSFGNFSLDPYYIQFADNTLSSNSTSTKSHLAGTYQYLYDGQNFQMKVVVADTLGYFYNFQKQP